MLYQQQFIKLAATFNKKNALGMTAALIFLALLYTLFWPASINSKTSVVLEIKSGQSASEIAELLKARGLIDSVLLFKGYATLLGQISQLKSGFYKFSARQNLIQIIYELSAGQVLRVDLTVPEGWTINQISAELNRLCQEQGGNCQFDLAELKVGEFKDSFTFLVNVPAEANLEGFLFPDTYELELGSATAKVALAMLSNFEVKTSGELAERLRSSTFGTYQTL